MKRTARKKQSQEETRTCRKSEGRRSEMEKVRREKMPWIHPNFVGTVFVAKFGYPGTTPNLLQFVLFWKLSEAFRTGVIKVFEKPFTDNN